MSNLRVNNRLVKRLLLSIGCLVIVGGLFAVFHKSQPANPGAPKPTTTATKPNDVLAPQPLGPSPTSQNLTRTYQPTTTGTTLVRTNKPDEVKAYAVSHNLTVTGTSVLATGGSLITLAQAPTDPRIATLDKSIPDTQTGPEVIYHALATPNDPLYPQWYSDKISLPAAWDISTGSSSVKVADIDTGFAMSHQDLTNKWAINSGEFGAGKDTNGIDDDGNGKIDDWRGWDFVSNDNNPTTSTISHGTETAGLIAAEANNSLGVAGTSWLSTVVPLRVLNNSGSGTTSAVISALAYARSLGVKVANLSLGSTSPDSLLQSEIDSDINAGMTVVAAAGNCGDADTFVFNNCNFDGQVIYPANYPEVIAVGATDSNDARAGFSSFGSNLDVVAPGSGTLQSTTISGANTTTAYSSTLNGTSYSAPIVSGVAALMYAHFPTITPGQVAEGLAASADKVSGMNGATRTDQYGYGRVNASSAVQIDKLACPNTIFSNYNIGGAITGEHAIANRSGGFDHLTITQPNNTNTGCIENYTWANNSYQSWSQLAATNSPAQNPSQVKLLTADLNGDGQDELYKIDYCGASGMIEVHGWSPSLQSWNLHAATNRPCISAANAEVIAADPDGGGRDSLFLVEYQNNGSGRVEVHQWSSNFQQWTRHIATNYGAIDPKYAQVIAGDPDGDGHDNFFLVNYSGTGGSVNTEIHGWSYDFQTWVSHIATCSPPMTHVDGSGNPVSDVITADTNGDSHDEFLKIDYTATGSGQIEVHGWTANLQNWVSHIVTSHGDY